MILKKRIPKDFYKLFRTRNRESYMTILGRLYEESNEVYAVLGLTEEECRAIIGETISRAQLVWEEDPEETEDMMVCASPGEILNRLVRWGWLKSDFDEKLNSYVLSFPEYSMLYTELFLKLQREDDSRERETILSVYSALFTYQADAEKNNDILRNALYTSRSLNQLLSNMQDGMRAYFDELSAKKDFIGIQEVLVEELNNSDSKKYTILTTADSFYRYKEAVKELIARILADNDEKKAQLLQKRSGLPAESAACRRNERAYERCQQTEKLTFLIDREFALIERKYNRLIDQKAVFAKRALDRIHYILQEGAGDGDNMLQLIRLLHQSGKEEEILEELGRTMPFSRQFMNVTQDSFFDRRDADGRVFAPAAVQLQEDREEEMADFVPRPLYTRKQLAEFVEKNSSRGYFAAGKDTVQSVEDLEKLLFVWQEATESRQDEDRVTLGQELRTADGMTFSALAIEKKKQLSSGS